MNSVKEISDILKVSKIMVYRFIKDNEITHSAKDGRTFLYDSKAFRLISDGLKDKSMISNETIVDNTDNIDYEKDDTVNDIEMIIEFLKSEIEIKNSQIEELTEINKNLTVTLQQQQSLLLNEQQRNTKLIEENIDKKKWWKWWK